MNPLINHLEKTLVRTEARVAELKAMLAIAKANEEAQKKPSK